MGRVLTSRVIGALAVWVTLWLGACGKSQIELTFDSAALKQSDLDARTLSLWKRNPIIDSQNFGMNAQSDLDLVPRTSLVFPEILDILAPIQSNDVIIYQSVANPTASAFYDVAGTVIPVSNTAFQEMMTYYHTTFVKNRATTLYPDVNFRLSTNKVLPITVYADENGSVGSSHYDPAQKEISLYFDSTGTLPNYHVADEADAVYHEFGHGIQDAMNSTVIGNPVSTPLALYPANRDIDSVIEGLADFNAAATARDDGILLYLSANLPFFLGPTSRNGTQYHRALENSLSFPDADVREIHLDGRVVASALNDLRLVMQGTSVNMPPGCTSGCTIVSVTANTLPSATAFDDVLQLGYWAYAASATTTTFYEYALLLLDRCANDTHVNSWCATVSVKTALTQILEGRGLVTSALAPNNAAVKWSGDSVADFDASTPATSATDLYFYHTMIPLPFPNDPAFNNQDANVDPCEVIALYPYFKNVNATDIFSDLTVQLVATSGYANLANPNTGGPVDDVQNVANAGVKLMGFMAPGEDTDSLINIVANPSARWYQAQYGSTLTQPLSSTYYPADVGWVAIAPAGDGAVASATFKITGRRYSASSINSSFTTIVTQHTTNSTGSGTSFCSSH